MELSVLGFYPVNPSIRPSFFKMCFLMHSASWVSAGVLFCILEFWIDIKGRNCGGSASHTSFPLFDPSVGFMQTNIVTVGVFNLKTQKQKNKNNLSKLLCVFLRHICSASCQANTKDKKTQLGLLQGETVNLAQLSQLYESRVTSRLCLVTSFSCIS